MSSFSGSEISNMISSKKYRVKKGDSLSGIADKFQGSFPSAKCMNKSSLMDKIYNMNKSAFGKTKDILYEGKDLDLNFLCDCRCHLKIDKSKKEHTFNDEDRLVFAIKGSRSFWDDYCKCDKEIGEYMKQTFNKSPGSSLPKSTPLPIKPSSSGSSNNKKLLGNIQKNLSDKMVTTNQIVIQFYKMTGNSASDSQINELRVQLEKENGVCRHASNVPCVISKDDITNLSCKCLEECYCKLKLPSNQISNIEKGWYIVSETDNSMFNQTPLLFWKKIIPLTGLSESEFHKIRDNFGYKKDKLEGNKIFIPSKKGLGNIKISFGKNAVSSSFKNENKEIISEMALHSNYLGANITKLVITSTSRDSVKQANLMIPYLTNIDSTMYPTVRGWLYKGKQEDGKTYYEQKKERIITESKFSDIAYELALKHVRNNMSAYGHVSSDGKVFDIGPNSSSHSSKDINYFNDSLEILEGEVLNSSSKKYGEGGEKAYHIVVK